MRYNKQGYKKKGFKKRPKKKQMQGLCVEVYNNNIEGALKIFKKKVKESKLLFDLKEKQYYKKPSEKKRERRAIARARYRSRTNSQKKY
jgi:small subunit ribosomal protein S21